MNAAVLVRMPVFASRAGQWVTLDRRRTAGQGVAAFVSCPHRRDLVQIVINATDAVTFDLTVEAVTSAFGDEWTEPAGHISTWVTDPEQGRQWFVVTFDGGDYADMTLQFDAERVGAFLADVALERCRDSVAAGGAA